ncbi:unnamed protein product, partial [Ascophyllum nodosum]
SSRHFPESKQLTKRRFYEQLRDPRPSTTTATTARNTLHILRIENFCNVFSRHSCLVSSGQEATASAQWKLLWKLRAPSVRACKAHSLRLSSLSTEVHGRVEARRGRRGQTSPGEERGNET